MSGLADARRAYLDQPSNHGRDDHQTRVAEADAFTAGWEAARAATQAAAREVAARQQLTSQPGERFSVVTSTCTVLDSHRPAVRAPFDDLASALSACRRLNANEQMPDLYLWTDR